MINLSKINLRNALSGQSLATLLMVALLVQIVPIEGYEVSLVKVGIMALAPIIFIFKAPYITKALWWGIVLWCTCFLCAYVQDYMRFSTLGYFALYIFAFIAFYNLVYTGAFSFQYFKKLLSVLIKTFGIVLVLQQICTLLGISDFPLINLDDQHFLAIDKLPSLTIEPSHTARIMTVLMLGYLRCLQIENDGERVGFKVLFAFGNRWVTGLFLWSMLTMGSGTAFIGLGILCLYFITRRNIWYLVPVIIGIISIANLFEIKQLTRALTTVEATMTGDTQQVLEADQSAAARVGPILNSIFDTDLTQKDTWFGQGTSQKQTYEQVTKNLGKGKIKILEQYGLLATFVSFILVYTCMIRRFFCIETLIFALLLGCSLGNVYYVWGCLMICCSMKYFMLQYKKQYQAQPPSE